MLIDFTIFYLRFLKCRRERTSIQHKSKAEIQRQETTMLDKLRYAIFGCMFCTLATAISGWCLPGGAYAQQPAKKLTVFIEPDVHYDSIWMAAYKGFYKDEGLDVDFRQFPTGMSALSAFTAGQGDIVLSGELPALLHWISVKGDYRLISV